MRLGILSLAPLRSRDSDTLPAPQPEPGDLTRTYS